MSLTCVFPKWLSLNSLNSMNRDKAQNWNVYQEYSMSSNSYILRWGSNNEIFTIMSI